MYAVRDRELPSAVREVFPWIANLLTIFFAIFRLVYPVVDRANRALAEMRANDRQVQQF